EHHFTAVPCTVDQNATAVTGGSGRQELTNESKCHPASEKSEQKDDSVQNEDRSREILEPVEQQHRDNAQDRTENHAFHEGYQIRDARVAPDPAIDADSEKREELQNYKKRRRLYEKIPIASVFERWKSQRVRDVIGKCDQKRVEKNFEYSTLVSDV